MASHPEAIRQEADELRATADEMRAPAGKQCTRGAGHHGKCNGYPASTCSTSVAPAPALSLLDAPIETPDRGAPSTLVKHLALGAGDVIVIEAQGSLQTIARERISATIQRALKDAGIVPPPIIILDNGMRFEVVRAVPGTSPFVMRNEVATIVQDLFDQGRVITPAERRY
jgi:hypothetical protein